MDSLRTLEDRHEVLKQGYTGNRMRVRGEEFFDKLAGIEQEAIGKNIIRNTPKDLEFESLFKKYPGMTRGVPLEDLHKVWDAITNDQANVARDTDAKPWSPREFPDEGLAYHPKSLSRVLEDDQPLKHISNTDEVFKGQRGQWFSTNGDPISFNPSGFGQALSTTGGTTPTYGFSTNYQPSPQAKAFGKVINILNDPHNSWMGFSLGDRVSNTLGWGR